MNVIQPLDHLLNTTKRTAVMNRLAGCAETYFYTTEEEIAGYVKGQLYFLLTELKLYPVRCFKGDNEIFITFEGLSNTYFIGDISHECLDSKVLMRSEILFDNHDINHI